MIRSVRLTSTPLQVDTLADRKKAAAIQRPVQVCAVVCTWRARKGPGRAHFGGWQRPLELSSDPCSALLPNLPVIVVVVVLVLLVVICPDGNTVVPRTSPSAKTIVRETGYKKNQCQK